MEQLNGRYKGFYVLLKYRSKYNHFTFTCSITENTFGHMSRTSNPFGNLKLISMHSYSDNE